MMEPGTLSTRLARLRDHIDPRLTTGEVERLVAGAARRHRRRRLRSWALGSTVLAASLLVLLRAVTHVPSETAVTKNAPTPSTAAQVIRLHDGSYATSAEAEAGAERRPAVISLEEDSPRRATLILREGKMRFHVVPARERTFTVEAGAVKVTVLGMAFTMERNADRVTVSAEDSPLLVEWGTGHRLLEVGESGSFPPAEAPITVVAPKASGQPVASSARARAGAPRAVPVPAGAAPLTTGPASPTVVTPATAPPGAKASAATASALASSALAASPTATPSLAARWEAADAARQEGRPREGAELLQRILDDHPTDPRAPLAAFTLGRVLLKDLARPREAAAAFARARALAPQGPFAEDALAREVEAWAATNEVATRRDRAEMYLRLFPAGRRVAAMAAWARP